MATTKNDGFRAQPGGLLRISSVNHNAWQDTADAVASSELTPLGGTLRGSHTGQVGIYGRNETAYDAIRGQVMNLGDHVVGSDLGESVLFELNTYDPDLPTAVLLDAIPSGEIGPIRISAGTAGHAPGSAGGLTAVFVEDATESSTRCTLGTTGVLFDADDGLIPILQYVEAVSGGAMCIVDMTNVATGGGTTAGSGGGMMVGVVATEKVAVSEYEVTISGVGTVDVVNLWEAVDQTWDATHSFISTRVSVGRYVGVWKSGGVYYMSECGINYSTGSYSG